MIKGFQNNQLKVSNKLNPINQQRGNTAFNMMDLDKIPVDI